MAHKPTYEDLEKRIAALEHRTDPPDHSNKMVQALINISRNLNAAADSSCFFNQVYTALNQILALQGFYIGQYREQPRLLSPVCLVWQDQVRNIPSEIQAAIQTLAQNVFRADTPLLLSADQVAERLTRQQASILGPAAFIGVPLENGAKKMGIMAGFLPEPDGLSETTADFFCTAGCLVSLALIKHQALDCQDELDILQNYLFNIINSMPSILIVVDKNCCVTQWNFQAELETGIKAGDAKTQSIQNVFPRISRYLELIQESIRFKRIKTRLRQQFTAGPETRFEDVIIYPLDTKKEEGAVIRMDDITDQVRLEEMMIQSEKMMSLGGLAAGMAHEINNPLAGMMQNAQVIYNRLNADIPANTAVADELGIAMADIRTYARKRQLFEKLDLINETGTRAAKIIRNMLGFARKGDTVLDPHNLPDLLRKTIRLIQNDYNLLDHYDFKQIRISEQFDDSMPPVPCDKTKIQQVLFNLLKNGAEAMFADQQPPFNPLFMFRTYPLQHMACIEIENNGPPISPEDQKRLFEPFFTTKPLGKGTGLGLSLSYYIIVKDHHGEMTVETTPEGYTRFTIKLPF